MDDFYKIPRDLLDQFLDSLRRERLMSEQVRRAEERLRTAALRAGRQESVIMATTGHRSRAMIARYYHSDPRIDAAAAGLL